MDTHESGSAKFIPRGSGNETTAKYTRHII